MPRALALDLATTTGHAVMERGRVPMFGTWKAPRTVEGEYGPAYAALWTFLDEMDQVHGFDAVGFEQPIKKRTDTLHILRLLTGFAVVVETWAGVVRLRPGRGSFQCVEVPVPTAKKALTGDSYAEKNAMVAAACRLGWRVANDHEADAGAVGLVTFETLWPTKRSIVA